MNVQMSEEGPVTRLVNWGRYVRRRRLAPAIRTIIDRYCYRSYRCVIDRSALAGPPAADHAGDVVFRLATPSDLDHLDELERYDRGSRQRAYVEQDNDWLFVACHGARIVATRRVSRVVRDGLISRVVQLRQGQLWAADVFCLPEYRNQGIARHLALFGDRFLASLGYEDRFGHVAVSNTPSLRLSRHKGNQPVYYVSYFRVLFWERLFVSKDIPRRFWAGLE